MAVLAYNIVISSLGAEGAGRCDSIVITSMVAEGSGAERVGRCASILITSLGQKELVAVLAF